MPKHLLVLFRFVGYQKLNEATTAIQYFDGFVFEHQQVRLRVSLAKPKLGQRDLQYSDRESTDELPKDAVTVQNGIGQETADSNSDKRYLCVVCCLFLLYTLRDSYTIMKT